MRVFYMYYIRFIMRELIYTPVYTEKKSLYSYLSCHTRKVFFRDFAINRPINLFCEIFGHLITALKFLNFHIADHPSAYLRSSTTLKYISNMFACWISIFHKNIDCSSYNSKLTRLKTTHLSCWICNIFFLDQIQK